MESKFLGQMSLAPPALPDMGQSSPGQLHQLEVLYLSRKFAQVDLQSAENGSPPVAR